jgi:hypothetical protein
MPETPDLAGKPTYGETIMQNQKATECHPYFESEFPRVLVHPARVHHGKGVAH